LGSNSTEACLVCPAGTTQPLEGKTSCDLCEEGSFSGGTGTTTPCQKCLPGSFQTGIGKSFCSSCSPGSFQVREKQLVVWVSECDDVDRYKNVPDVKRNVLLKCL
jgi:hypothetical protein